MLFAYRLSYCISILSYEMFRFNLFVKIISNILVYQYQYVR